MSIRINDPAPDFNAKTSTGEINFHDWMGDAVFPSEGLHPRLRN
jgi:alkyl hydroperoxide reductase subunit AhpC